MVAKTLLSNCAQWPKCPGKPQQQTNPLRWRQRHNVAQQRRRGRLQSEKVCRAHFVAMFFWRAWPNRATDTAPTRKRKHAARGTYAMDRLMQVFDSLVYEMEEEADSEREHDDDDDDAAIDHSEIILRAFMQTLDVTRPQAEAALEACDGCPHGALRSMVAPPPEEEPVQCTLGDAPPPRRRAEAPPQPLRVTPADVSAWYAASLYDDATAMPTCRFRREVSARFPSADLAEPQAITEMRQLTATVAALPKPPGPPERVAAIYLAAALAHCNDPCAIIEQGAKRQRPAGFHGRPLTDVYCCDAALRDQLKTLFATMAPAAAAHQFMRLSGLHATST